MLKMCVLNIIICLICKTCNYMTCKYFMGKLFEEMSQPGTWCDNIIIQAGANALSCTIHITDSSRNANATIVNPTSLHQRQKIVFS